jgi:GNAT superfamily N-acetyltransferase
MTATSSHILPRHYLSVTEIDQLEDRLYEHNRRATGRDDGKGLAFVVVDEHGIQIGAIAGYSWAGMAEIKQLWVDEGYRGHGLGQRLLDAAIAEAIVRGCQSVHHRRIRPAMDETCGRVPLSLAERSASFLVRTARQSVGPGAPLSTPDCAMGREARERVV